MAYCFSITSQGVDHLTGEHLAKYDRIREEFMEAFEYEEKLKNGWKLQRDIYEESMGNWKLLLLSSLIFDHRAFQFVGTKYTAKVFERG